MNFDEWAKNSKWDFDSSEYAKEIKAIAEAAWEAAWDAAQPKWRPIETAPLNKRILAAMEGNEPDICKLSLSPSGILVAQLDCGSRYNAKSIYEVYMELPKP